MAVKSNIIGGHYGNTVAHVHSPATSAGHIAGLVTYTSPLYQPTLTTGILANAAFGTDLKAAVPSAGTPTVIYNGGDTSAFTATAIRGTWDFASTTQVNNGTFSVDGTGTVNNDVAAFTNVSSLTLANFEVLNISIYLTSWTPGSNHEIYITLREAGAVLTDSVRLSDYIDQTRLDEWQKATIPLTAFNAAGTAFDELRITTEDTGPGAPINFYLDDIELNTVAGSSIFKYAPSQEQDQALLDFKLTTAATTTNVNYNEFFGIPALSNGIQVQVKSQGSNLINFFIRDLFDFARLPGVELSTYVGATTTMFEARVQVPYDYVLVKGSSADEITVTVADDISSLLRCEATVRLVNRNLA